MFRLEDLDPQRCRPEFSAAAVEDLRWLGLEWDGEPHGETTWSGGICDPRHGPEFAFRQSKRTALYLAAWRRLRESGCLFPCSRSRKDMREAPQAPHSGEAIYPAAWRPESVDWAKYGVPDGINWRFRVPDGRKISFRDGRCGVFSAVAGRDFGDFPVWRRDGVPAYELAVVVDDAAMGITEVVRGEDLLLSTCRQILLYEALAATAPQFFHTPLWIDAEGRRLAKRSASLSLRSLRKGGVTPDKVRGWISEFLARASLNDAKKYEAKPIHPFTD